MSKSAKNLLMFLGGGLFAILIFYTYVIVQFGNATGQTARGLQEMIRSNPNVVPRVETMATDSLSSYLINTSDDTTVTTISWGDSTILLIMKQ